LQSLIAVASNAVSDNGVWSTRLQEARYNDFIEAPGAGSSFPGLTKFREAHGKLENTGQN